MSNRRAERNLFLNLNWQVLRLEKRSLLLCLATDLGTGFWLKTTGLKQIALRHRFEER